MGEVGEAGEAGGDVNSRLARGRLRITRMRARGMHGRVVARRRAYARA